MPAKAWLHDQLGAYCNTGFAYCLDMQDFGPFIEKQRSTSDSGQVVLRHRAFLCSQRTQADLISYEVQTCKCMLALLQPMQYALLDCQMFGTC